MGLSDRFDERPADDPPIDNHYFFIFQLLAMNGLPAPLCRNDLKNFPFSLLGHPVNIVLVVETDRSNPAFAVRAASPFTSVNFQFFGVPWSP
jgi:hypothetical protein